MEAARHELPALERVVTRIARDWRSQEPESYVEELAEFYIGGLAAFGWQGPDPEELLEADLWLLFAPGPGDEESIIAQATKQAPGDARLSVLATSTLRAWSVKAAEPTGALRATCPFTGEERTLWTPRGTHGPPPTGRWVVARTVTLASGASGLLGRVPVVLDDVGGDFEALLDELAGPGGQPPEDEGTLFHAAWSWPEEREHTREGEVVAGAHASFDVADAEAGVAALDAAPPLRRHHDPEPDEEDVLEWHWPVEDDPDIVLPCPEPGVRWTLCREDREGPPRRGEIQVDTWRGELWLFAPTPRRLGELERALAATAVAGGLARESGRHVDRPEIVTRWQRERWERSLARLERSWGCLTPARAA